MSNPVKGLDLARKIFDSNEVVEALGGPAGGYLGLEGGGFGHLGAKYGHLGEDGYKPSDWYAPEQFFDPKAYFDADAVLDGIAENLAERYR